MMKNNKGLTLLEVVVAITILTVIIIPLVNIMPNFRRSNEKYSNYKKLMYNKDSFYSELQRIMMYDGRSIVLTVSRDYPMIAGNPIPSAWDNMLSNVLDVGVVASLNASVYSGESLASSFDYTFFIDKDGNGSLGTGESSIVGHWLFVRPDNSFAGVVFQ